MDANTDTVGSYANLLKRDDEFDEVFDDNKPSDEITPDPSHNHLSVPERGRSLASPDSQVHVGETHRRLGTSGGTPTVSGQDAVDGTAAEIINRRVRFRVDRTPSHIARVDTPTSQLDQSVSIESQDIAAAEKTKRRKKSREFKTRIVIGFLFVLIIVGVTLIFHFYHRKLNQQILGKTFFLMEDTRHLTVVNNNRDKVLQGKLGVNMPDHTLPIICSNSEDGGHSDELVCLSWRDRATLHVAQRAEGEADCYAISWQSLNPDLVPADCYELGGRYWYGMGLMHDQRWPLNNASVAKIPFLAGTVHDEDSLGSVLEPYWLSSAGVSLMVDPDTPLHVSWNAPIPDDTSSNDTSTDGKLCLHGDFDNSPYPNPEQKLPFLNYTICVAANIRAVHDLSVRRFATPPRSQPRESVFRQPVWSTWAFFKENITQDKVAAYAEGIVRNNYGQSAIVLEDGWESAYGDLDFDNDTFPDPVSLIRDLKSKGFGVMVTTHPYVSVESDAFVDTLAADVVVRDASGRVPGLTRWWDGPPDRRWDRGIATVYDMDPSAQAWLKARLDRFATSFEVDSFRMDGGELDMLPYFPTFAENFTSPNQYLGSLAQFASEFGDMAQARVAYKSQNATVLTRIAGRTSTWSGPLGLASVIPSALTMGVLGYPYILNDVIGGNAYDNMPSKELYIRWLELSAFLPVMQFSIPPDHFDSQTAQFARDLIERHSLAVTEEVLKVIADAATSLNPIVRPLWWQWPEDEVTFTIDSQFMVGDALMVAPVVLEGADARAVYLPRGTWTDLTLGVAYRGPTWLAHYAAPLDRVPYFKLSAA